LAHYRGPEKLSNGSDRTQGVRPVALDYAFETLKRRGLSKSLERDRTAITITVGRDQKDRHGKNAVEVLECKVKK
jgi:hypothetical protein